MPIFVISKEGRSTFKNKGGNNVRILIYLTALSF